MINYITAGESHGKYLSAILEGMPSGIRIDTAAINDQLHLRQQGYGRGPRMNIEKDRIVITAGIYKGITTGAPIGLMIVNKDVTIDELPQLQRPRPGHADYSGALKYNQGIREILERASARETALRVAVGSICKQALTFFDIHVTSHVVCVGKVRVKKELLSYKKVKNMTKWSMLNCTSPEDEKKMINEIKKAIKNEDTLGGEFEVVVAGVPVGLGSHVHYGRKLDANIAAALMSMQSIKAVQFGLGCDFASTLGSGAHDELFFTKQQGYYRRTNNAGGIEGGISNGSDIIVRATMKPIATLKKPLKSVDMKTLKSSSASFERSDVCAVTAGSVIGEAVVAYEISKAFLDKFGGDSLAEIKRNFKGYVKQITG